jgi:hypothetical protein
MESRQLEIKKYVTVEGDCPNTSWISIFMIGLTRVKVKG